MGTDRFFAVIPFQTKEQLNYFVSVSEQVCSEEKALGACGQQGKERNLRTFRGLERDRERNEIPSGRHEEKYYLL